MNIRDTELPAGVDVRRLRYFAAVAEELHFGHAADRLSIAQPALSQQIKALEAALGVRLLERDSRTVSLTPAGRYLHERTHRLFDDLRETVAGTVATAGGRLGSLRLGFVSSAAGLVAGAIASFTAAYPRVDVRLVEGFTDQNAAAFAQGRLDAVVVRDGAPLDGGRAQILLEEPFTAVVPEAHPLATRDAITAGDLADENFVFYPRQAGRRAWERNLEPLTEIGATPAIVQVASTWTTILHLVAAGVGVTLAPRSVTTTPVPGSRAIPLRGTSVRTRIEFVQAIDEENVAARNLGSTMAARAASSSGPADRVTTSHARGAQ